MGLSTLWLKSVWMEGCKSLVLLSIWCGSIKENCISHEKPKKCMTKLQHTNHHRNQTLIIIHDNCICNAKHYHWSYLNIQFWEYYSQPINMKKFNGIYKSSLLEYLTDLPARIQISETASGNGLELEDSGKATWCINSIEFLQVDWLWKIFSKLYIQIISRIVFCIKRYSCRVW